MSQINSNYSYELGMAIEQAMGSEVINAFSPSQPIVSSLLNKGRRSDLNNERAARLMNGLSVDSHKAIIPVRAVTTSASGMSRSDSFNTGLTPEFRDNSKVGIAAYTTAKYREVIAFDTDEQELLSNPSTTRGYDIVESAMANSTAAIYDLIENDLYSSTVESESKVMGFPYFLSTSNTVGGISQTTFTNWAANVDAINAAISAAYLRQGLTLSKRMAANTPGMNKAPQADLIYLTENASGKLYSAAQALADGTYQNIVQFDGTVPTRTAVSQVGAQELVWGGAWLVEVPLATTIAGKQIWYINSGALWLLMPTAPIVAGNNYNALKFRHEIALYMPVNFGVSNPRLCVKQTGVSQS